MPVDHGSTSSDEPPPQRPGERLLSAAEVRRLAAAGVAAMGVRQVAVRVIGLGGTVVLARLLVPRDFGAVAIGITLVTVFGFLGDAGIGAGLIRGPKAPERGDLAAFLGLQILITAALAAATAAATLHLGQVGRVTALMVVSLPVVAFRAPGVIMFERDLRYQPLVVVELIETLTYYAWAIGTVLLGWGVWGLASATPVRAVVGAVIMTAISPVGILVPTLAWTRIRGLLRFGMQYQAVGGVALARDQGLNLGTATIAGVSVLGLWSLAYRVMQVPFLLFESVWRVSFPAMARLVAAGEKPRPIMERGLAMASVVTGGVLAALVGSTPALIPSVFGHQWAPSSAVIPWAALGLMFAGPVSVATAGYLYATGDSWSVLVSTVLSTVAWLLVAFSLLPFLGVEAIGIGWLVSSIVEAFVLVARTRRHTPVDVVRHLAVPACLGAMAAAIGWLAASQLGPTLVSAVLGAVVAAGVYLAGAVLLCRPLLVDVFVLGRRSLSSLGR